MATLTFLGAARTVTGSKYLLERNGKRLLIDCGLFQGMKELRERNWKDLPIDPATIAAAVLTHAHIDHCGYLPRLVAHGFHGRVFCTPATMDLCGIVLPDAARLAEEDARHANTAGFTKHSPALPLFSEADAYRALSQLQPVGFSRPIDPIGPDSGIQIEFVPAGHLLGSAYVWLTMKNESGSGSTRILFGGDLGRYSRPILPDPSPRPASDILLCESTYGDRTHPSDDDGERLASIVRDTHARGGKLIIPSFAIGRVEEVLYWLTKLEQEKRIPVLPLYLDSPMAVTALKFYANRSIELDVDARPARGQLRAFFAQRVTTVDSGHASAELVASTHPAIIISSSGMATGGRVLNHLTGALPDPKHTVLFVGYQAAGTRGRRLVDGEKQVKIHGAWVPVAARIERIDSMSAHADAGEILRWLRTESATPRVTYLVHGEPGPMDTLKAKIQRELGWRVETPSHEQKVELEGSGLGS